MDLSKFELSDLKRAAAWSASSIGLWSPGRGRKHPP